MATASTEATFVFRKPAAADTAARYWGGANAQHGLAAVFFNSGLCLPLARKQTNWVRPMMSVPRDRPEAADRVKATRLPSRPGEFHPEPLTDPDLILSHHPARAID
jgi:hypothetical protein